MSKNGQEQIRVPAHVEYLHEIRDFVAKAARKYRCSSRTANALRYAVEEAASNIIKHAYKGRGGTITVRVRGFKDRVELSIIDQGRYFDPRRVKAPDLQKYVEEGRRGGLGIFIIRKLVDEIDYRKTPEGNELRLVKYKEQAKRKLSVPSVPLGLKVRYTVIACAVITVVVGALYLLQYGKIDDEIIAQYVGRGRDICVPVANSVAAAIAEAENETEAQLFAGRALKSSLKGNEQFVVKAFVVDSTGRVLFSTRLFEIDEQFRLPDKHTAFNVWAYYYRLPDGSEVFDISAPVVVREGENPIGVAHIWIRKEEANELIRRTRLARLRNSLFLLVVAYGGVFFLVYLVTSPLRKLAYWVREAGKGAPPEEELVLDESSEVGEIAKAFSSITHRLKESEKSLAEKQELDREIQVAREIQQTLLPSEFPKIEGYEIAAFYEAAKVVGGDYYDFVEVDKDVYGIAVADVSGKGVPGSLVMTMIRTALRTEARGVLDAAEVLRRVNEFVIRDMKKGMFVTIFYAILDTRRRRLNYASAGHNPMIVYRGRTRKTYYLNPRGLPIGLDLPDPGTFNRSIESDTIRLAEDDIIILYTDGITEAMNSRRELFGEERFLQVIREYGHLPAEAFIEKLKDELHSFTEGEPQNDDITVVVLKEKLTPEKVEFNRAKEAHRLILSGKSIREACELAGITTYAYYTRYKKLFETKGLEAFELEDEETSIEAKHLSIEEKVKIYDVILRHPEYGAKRISEELNTERYGFTKISESKIYDELVRSRLNTRQMREAFAARNAHKGRPKPPGAPLLTLDGQPVIPASYREEWEPVEEKPAEPVPEELELTAEEEEVALDETAGAMGDETPVEGVAREEEAAEVAEDFLEAFLESEETPEEVEDRAEVVEEEPGIEEIPDEAVEEELPLASSFEDLLLSEGEEIESEPEARDEQEQPAEEDFAQLIAKHLEEELSSDEEEFAPPAAPAEESAVEMEPEEQEQEEEPAGLEALAGIGDIIQNAEETEEGEPENGKTESALEEEAPISFVDLVKKIEEELSYITGVPAQRGTEQRSVSPEEGVRHPDEEGRQEERAESDAAEAKTRRQRNLARGLRYYRRKEYEKAIEEFRKLVEEFPEYKEAWSILGNAYYRAGRLDEAVEAYGRVKELDPLDTDAYENTGVIFANRGEYGRAIEEWQKILKIDPSRRDILYHIQKAKRLMARRGASS